MRVFRVDKALTIDGDLMCQMHQKQRGKKKRETSKTKLQVPFAISYHLYTMEQSRKPDLGSWALLY